MGQAKQRGTFEERRRQAQERLAEERLQAAKKRRQEREAEDAYIATLTDRERERFLARRRSPSITPMMLLASAIASTTVIHRYRR